MSVSGVAMRRSEVRRSPPAQEGLHHGACAIGAAVAPPKPRLVLEHDGDGDLRAVGGRERDEPRRVEAGARPSRRCRSCPPTLSPEIARRSPVPLVTTVSIICVELAAVCGEIALPELVGLRTGDGRAVRGRDPVDEVRLHDDSAVGDRRRRPSPSAAASLASRSCPKASRPGSTCEPGRFGSKSWPVAVEPARRAARPPACRAAASSRSRSASRSRASTPAPSSLPISQKTELIECVERRRRSRPLPKTSGPLWSAKLRDLLAVLDAVARVDERRLRRVAAAVERGRRGHAP